MIECIPNPRRRKLFILFLSSSIISLISRKGLLLTEKHWKQVMMKKGKPRGSSHLFKFQRSTLVNFTFEDTHISFTCELNSLAFHWQAYRLFYPSLVRIFFFSKARQVNINNSLPNLNYISAVFEDNFTTDYYGLRLVLQFFHQSWVFPKVR